MMSFDFPKNFFNNRNGLDHELFAKKLFIHHYIYFSSKNIFWTPKKFNTLKLFIHHYNNSFKKYLLTPLNFNILKLKSKIPLLLQTNNDVSIQNPNVIAIFWLFLTFACKSSIFHVHHPTNHNNKTNAAGGFGSRFHFLIRKLIRMNQK